MTTIFKRAEDAIVADAEVVGGFLSGIFTDEVEPFFKNALALVERNGGALLIKAAGDALPALVSGKWGVSVTQIIADAKAAGAALIPQEEQLAASTALQIVQAATTAIASTIASSTSAST